MRISDWSSDVCSSDLSDQVERAVVHHPPLRVPRLGPGIGVEQIGEGERPVGDAPQHLKRITVLDADIAERRMLPMIAGDMDERLCDAVDEGFGADEAMVGDRKSTRLNSSH